MKDQILNLVSSYPVLYDLSLNVYRDITKIKIRKELAENRGGSAEWN